jgi:hypothetical protein
MRGRGSCGSKPTCDDDAYLAEMKQKTAALKKDQDARMKKELKGVKVEMEKLNQIINPMHKDVIAEMNNLGGRKTRRRRRSKKLTGRK